MGNYTPPEKKMIMFVFQFPIQPVHKIPEWNKELYGKIMLPSLDLRLFHTQTMEEKISQ
jgi:hypothetical protein